MKLWPKFSNLKWRGCPYSLEPLSCPPWIYQPQVETNPFLVSKHLIFRLQFLNLCDYWWRYITTREYPGKSASFSGTKTFLVTSILARGIWIKLLYAWIILKNLVAFPKRLLIVKMFHREDSVIFPLRKPWCGAKKCKNSLAVWGGWKLFFISKTFLNEEEKFYLVIIKFQWQGPQLKVVKSSLQGGQNQFCFEWGWQKKKKALAPSGFSS